MSAESPAIDTTTDNKPNLDSILKRLSRIEHLVALLIIGLSAEDLTDDQFEAWDAAVAWRHEDFDGPALLETLPNPYEPRSATRTFSPDQPVEPTTQ